VPSARHKATTTAAFVPDARQTAAFFAASPTKNERFQALIATIFCHDDWTISTVF
jgi:hypothetical protein